jgi:hypothetical protein
VSEWENVGSYRRALSSYDVKMAAGVLMGAVVNEPTAYEAIETIETSDAVTRPDEAP